MMETLATPTTTSASATSASTAVISLTRSGIRADSPLSLPTAHPSTARSGAPCVPIAHSRFITRSAADPATDHSARSGAPFALPLRRQAQHVADATQRVDEARTDLVELAAQHGHV